MGQGVEYDPNRRALGKENMRTQHILHFLLHNPTKCLYFSASLPFLSGRNCWEEESIVCDSALKQVSDFSEWFSRILTKHIKFTQVLKVSVELFSSQ